MRPFFVIPIALLVTGCASLSSPSAERMAALPVVTFPNQPPAGDFILKLPAGQPIPLKVVIGGSLLAKGTVETLTATLAKDVYVHRHWASEDGKTWVRARDLVGVNLGLSLPSDAHPRPGEITLIVNRKPAG
jgi:hypothetical protein